MMISLANKEKGFYKVILSNLAGQIVLTTQLKHNGYKTTYEIKLPAGIGKGIYQLQAASPSNEKSRVNILVTE